MVGKDWPWLLAGIAVGGGTTAKYRRGCAVMTAVIGLSSVVLRSVLRPRLIATFVGIVASGIVMGGLLFDAVP